MDQQVSWHVELAVKPNQLANFQALTGEMVADTRPETGVLAYERYVTEDGKLVHVYERYANAAAALAHLEKFKKLFGDRFSTMVERRRFTVFGQPSDDLKKVLDAFGVTYAKPFGDFAYWTHR